MDHSSVEKFQKSMMKLLVSIFLGSAPFTPYCRDITKGKNVGIRTFMSAKKLIFGLFILI
jgi:hypothetical protein